MASGTLEMMQRCMAAPCLMPSGLTLHRINLGTRHWMQLFSTYDLLLYPGVRQSHGRLRRLQLLLLVADNSLGLHDVYRAAAEVNWLL